MFEVVSLLFFLQLEPYHPLLCFHDYYDFTDVGITEGIILKLARMKPNGGREVNSGKAYNSMQYNDLSLFNI